MKTNLATKTLEFQENYSYHKRILNLIPDLVFQITVNSSTDFYFSYLNKSIISFFEVNQFELNCNPLEVIKSRIHPDDREDFFNSIFLTASSLVIASEFTSCIKRFNSESDI